MSPRTAKANVNPVRQRTQYSCMSASMAMCLNALDHEVGEDEVNKVMGARPMKGAAWEDALACAQHYGCRATLTTPSTVKQLRKWTDAGVPVMIAWNPEGREWSHASVAYHVTEGPIEALDESQIIQGEGPGLYVFVADPNIPNPDKTTRIVHEDLFYSKWYEKWPNYLVRRPACAIEREVTSGGRQVVAARMPKGWPTGTNAFAVYALIEKHGFVPDRIPPTSLQSAKRVLAWGGLEKRRGGGFQLTDKGKELLDEHGYLKKLRLASAAKVAARARSREEMIEKYKHLSFAVRSFLGIPPEDGGGNTEWGDGYFFNQRIRSRYKVKDSDELIKKLKIDPKDLRGCCSKWRAASAQKVAERALTAGSYKRLDPSRWKRRYDKNYADEVGWYYEPLNRSDKTDMVLLGIAMRLAGKKSLPKPLLRLYHSRSSWDVKQGMLDAWHDLENRYLSTMKKIPLYPAGARMDIPKGFPTNALEVQVLSDKEQAWVEENFEFDQVDPNWVKLYGKSKGTPKADSGGSDNTKERLEVLDQLLAKRPDRFIQSLRDQISRGKTLTDKQLKALRRNLYQNRMRGEADLFRMARKKKKTQPARRLGPGAALLKRRPGAGAHHTREQDVESGRSRKPKHKRDLRRDHAASAGRVAARYLGEDDA